MGKLVFGMMLSLDGYVAGVDGGLLPPPAPRSMVTSTTMFAGSPAFCTVAVCTR
jgi:hypothetical protein